MIIGRGLLANALKKLDENRYLFYANGISNSVLENIPEDNFEVKQINEIANKNREKTLVYFSTIQVNSKENFDRPYVKHKLKTEQLIKELFPDYIIVRTSNLVGLNPWNTHTLFNFLYNSLRSGTEINVVDSAIRNLLDIDDFMEMLHCYLLNFETKNTTRNIINPVSYRMASIVEEFEKAFSRKFIRNDSPVSIAFFEAPCKFSLSLVKKCHINLDNYLNKLIKKYYLQDLKSRSSS